MPRSNLLHLLWIGERLQRGRYHKKLSALVHSFLQSYVLFEGYNPANRNKFSFFLVGKETREHCNVFIFLVKSYNNNKFCWDRHEEKAFVKNSLLLFMYIQSVIHNMAIKLFLKKC